jgi:hypothetical protein
MSVYLMTHFLLSSTFSFYCSKHTWRRGAEGSANLHLQKWHILSISLVPLSAYNWSFHRHAWIFMKKANFELKIFTNNPLEHQRMFFFRLNPILQNQHERKWIFFYSNFVPITLRRLQYKNFSQFLLLKHKKRKKSMWKHVKV